MTWQTFIFKKSCFSVFLLYRALPIKVYIWQKFWDIWDSMVFSDGRVYGAIRLGMLLDSKKGDRASANSYPSVCLVRLVLTAFTTDSPCLGGGEALVRRGNQGFTLGKGVKPWWECRSLVRARYNFYTLWEPLTNFFGDHNACYFYPLQKFQHV